MSMLSNKDLRSIAAYWEAGCTAFWVENEAHPDKFTINSRLFELLECDVFDSIKLHLRPISSLTDGELVQIGATIGLLNVAVSRNKPGVYELAIIGQWSVAEGESTDPIWFDVDKIDGLVSGGYTDDDFYQDEIIYYYPAKVFAYLQSIGVYVPGSIDEQYVELV